MGISLAKEDYDSTAEEAVTRIFDTEDIKSDLKRQSVRSGAVTMVAQGAKFLLQMGSTFILARLLAPQEFGLVAMVTAVTGFVTMFKDMGLSTATIQKAEINEAQISTLFWINVALSLLIVLFTAALAPVVAWFYGEPRLIWVTLVLAVALVFGGFTIQHQALLRRQMRFGALATIEITAMTSGITVAVIAACYGFGYWALVLMHLTIAFVTAIGVWLACDWRPSKPARRSGVRSMLAFGGNLTGFNVINYFARNLDNLLIGKFWGAGQLGLYTKAYGLLLLPLRQVTTPITAVAIPVLSRLQDDPGKYEQYYYKAISVIAFITMPLVVGMAALSDEIIRIVLGEQWLEAAAIFRVLAFVALCQPVVSTTGWIYISLGQTKRMMRWGLISVPVIGISFLIGLPWGPLGVATSYAVCAVVVLAVPCLLFAFRYSPISVGGFFKAIMCPLVISLIMYFVLELTGWYLASHNSVYILLHSFVMGLLVFGLALLFWPKARDEALGTLRMVKMLRSRNVEVNNESLGE